MKLFERSFEEKSVSGKESSQQDQKEVKEIDEGYEIMKEIKEKLESLVAKEKLEVRDMQETSEMSKKAGEVRKYIKLNLPSLSKECFARREGFYNMAHTMVNAAEYIEEVLPTGNRSQMETVSKAAEQVIRLMEHGMRETRWEERDKILRRTREVSLNLPYLLEIPPEWRASEKGIKFDKKIEDFIKRRKEKKLVEQEDFNLLNDALEIISECYKEATFSKRRIEKAPHAQSIIYINIGLLLRECKKYKNQLLPHTKNFSNVQLIRGIFNYKEKEEAKRESLSYLGKEFPKMYGMPKIVKQPEKLRV